MHYLDLIVILEQVRDKIIESKNFKSSHFKSKEEAIIFIKSIIRRLYDDDLEAVDTIVYAFGDDGYIKEIAINDNWLDEYAGIEEFFGNSIINIRNKDFTNLELYENIKYKNLTPVKNPARLSLSEKKWNFFKEFCEFSFKEKINLKRLKKSLEYNLLIESVNPAIVTLLNPLLVSVYARPLDAVIILSFPQEFIHKYNLTLNQKLIAINLYSKINLNYDIFYGEKYQDYLDVTSFIADFLSEDAEKLKKHKANILPSTWEYVKKKTNDYREKYKELRRPIFINLYNK